MKQFSVFLLILVLCGCSSAPPTGQQIYLLNIDAPHSSTGDKNIKQLVVVEKILLAEYLKRPNLVMQVDGNQLYYSDIDLWAENLQTDIHKTLTAWLNDRAKHTRFVAYNSPEARLDLKHLVVSIEYFMPTDQGTVVSNGQYWWVENSKMDNPTSQNSFSYESALTQKGYSHSVSQLAQQLAQLSTQIIKDVE
tara:strand:+ start:216 stop:794 length:579 start_codon:yes stop_codon:yes gene_type:complete